jgi:hypothetical protein
LGISSQHREQGEATWERTRNSKATLRTRTSSFCLLREKNILSRADIEELCDKVQARVAHHDSDPLPCHMAGARAAATEVAQIGDYIGRKYGGKHRRTI